MTDWNIATGAEQPINRTGLDNVQISGSGVQGTLVGVDDSGSSPKLVAADADAAADGAGSAPIAAVGVLLPREIIKEDMSGVNTHPWDDVEKQIYKEERTLTGDRATVVSHGVELVNDDDDTSFAPGEPVYLDKGGGFTQTEPAQAGDAVQCVGVALTPEDQDRNHTGRPRILLDVQYDYDTV